MTVREKAILLRHIPEQSLPIVKDWMQRYPVKLAIKKPRKTKLGDFRPAQRHLPHRISVNADLHPHAFLLVLAHEMAHLICWLQHERNARPHGREWKENYARLVQPIIDQEIFPGDFQEVVVKEMENPSASSCASPALKRAMDALKGHVKVYLDDLTDGASFSLQNGQQYERGAKRRTRYVCREMHTGRLYLISGMMEIKPL